MLKNIIKRLGIGVVTIWVITTLLFFLLHSLPGDPFASDKKIPAKVKAQIEKKYHLDKPIYVQYGYYLKDVVVHQDLGISMKIRGRKVNSIISNHFPKSLTIGLLATVFAMFFGTIIGTIAGFARGKLGDKLAMLVAIVGVSVPSFILGGMFQWIIIEIKEKTGVSILPIAGYGDGDLYHLLGPSITLGLMPLAVIARMMRASVIEVLSQDYIRTARAKGISTLQIVIKHVLRNAIMPIITYLGILVAGITTGSFVIESVFAIPGLGKYFVESIQNRDYTVVLGVILFYSAFLILMLILTDVLYGLIDPRVRRGKGAK